MINHIKSRWYVLIITGLLGFFSLASFSQNNLDTLNQSVVEQRVDTVSKVGGFFSELESQVPEKPAKVLDLISFSKIFWSIVLIFIGYYLMRFFLMILNLIAERSNKFRISLKSIIPVVRIGMWVIIIFIVIKGIFNPPVETIIAVTASISIAVGFAAQDILKNVFGGIVLLLDRPFKVGDKIDTGKYYGEVIEIGLRITRLVTVDDSVVSVPNAELISTSISNSNSGELNCQVVAEIFMPIHVDTGLVRRIALEAAQVSKYIYLKKPVYVHFIPVYNNKTTFFKMRLKAYVMDVRYEASFKSDMTEIVIRELFKNGVLSEEKPI